MTKTPLLKITLLHVPESGEATLVHVTPLFVDRACLLVPTITKTPFPNVTLFQIPESGEATLVHVAPLSIDLACLPAEKT